MLTIKRAFSYKEEGNEVCIQFEENGKVYRYSKRNVILINEQSFSHIFDTKEVKKTEFPKAGDTVVLKRKTDNFIKYAKIISPDTTIVRYKCQIGAYGQTPVDISNIVSNLPEETEKELFVTEFSEVGKMLMGKKINDTVILLSLEGDKEEYIITKILEN